MINEYRETQRYLSLQKLADSYPVEYSSEANPYFDDLAEKLKKTSNLHFSGTENPKGIIRAFVLLARWFLFEENRTVEETSDLLWNWYFDVMRLMYLSEKSAKTYKEQMDKLPNKRDNIRNNEIGDNLDQIKTYQSICRAKANGPLRREDPKIPQRILQLWQKLNISREERALFLLYHYLGPDTCVTKEAIALWNSYGITQNYRFETLKSADKDTESDENIETSKCGLFTRRFYKQDASYIRIREEYKFCVEWNDEENDSIVFDEWPEDRTENIAKRLGKLPKAKIDYLEDTKTGCGLLLKKQESRNEIELSVLVQKKTNPSGTPNKKGVPKFDMWVCILVQKGEELGLLRTSEKVDWQFVNRFPKAELSWDPDAVLQWATGHEEFLGTLFMEAESAFQDASIGARKLRFRNSKDHPCSFQILS